MLITILLQLWNSVGWFGACWFGIWRMMALCCASAIAPFFDWYLISVALERVCGLCCWSHRRRRRPLFFLFCWLLFTYLYYCFVLAVDLWRVVGDSSSASATAVAVADIEAPKTHSTMPGICPRCTKNVYFAEEKIALGKSFHKMCFQCGTPLWRWSASVSLRATCHSCHSCHVQWLPELESAVMIASCCRLLDAPVEMRLTCAIYITCIWYIYIWYIWYCSGGDIGFNGRKWNLNCQVDYSCYVTEREREVWGGGKGSWRNCFKLAADSVCWLLKCVTSRADE